MRPALTSSRLVALLLGPATSHANCEAGGFVIHTTAAYRKPRTDSAYLRFERKGSTLRFRRSALDGADDYTARRGPFTLRTPEGTCKVPGLGVDPKYLKEKDLIEVPMP